MSIIQAISLGLAQYIISPAQTRTAARERDADVFHFTLYWVLGVSVYIGYISRGYCRGFPLYLILDHIWIPY